VTSCAPEARKASGLARAGVASTFDLHFDVVLPHGTRNASRRDEPHGVAGQTGDVAAVRAQEVRVLGVRLSSDAHELEAPHMVSQVVSRDQASLDEIDEVAVNGGSVVARGRKFFCDFSMADGCGRPFEALQHGDARGGPPQASRA
jgi:hypothetical protein